MKTLYLAGPINQCSDAEAHDWRESVKAQLAGRFEFLDPMSRDYRGKEAQSVDEIVDGDMKDILDSDLILANCPKPSAGTSMEIFFASFCHNMPVVAVVPGNPSPWIARFSKKVFPDMASAVQYLAGF